MTKTEVNVPRKFEIGDAVKVQVEGIEGPTDATVVATGKADDGSSLIRVRFRGRDGGDAEAWVDAGSLAGGDHWTVDPTKIDGYEEAGRAIREQKPRRAEPTQQRAAAADSDPPPTAA